MFDVIISGAGPAGSRCAEIIAKAGYKVALIERDANHRKVCGGGIPRSKIFNYFPQLKKLKFNKINGTTIYSADYHKIEHIYKNLKIYPIAVDRLIFDNLLRNIAIDAGAKLIDKNISLDFIYKNGQRIGIKTRTKCGLKEYFGKVIIIADGMSSKLALRSGLRAKWKIKEIGIGKAAILEGKHNLKEHMGYFFFKKYGYCWIFPLSNNRFNIGSITYFEKNLKYNVNITFKKFVINIQKRGLLRNLNYKKFWSGCFPEPVTGISKKEICGDNVILIGDAGGFTAPISGEGILPAVISGDIAGQTVINALIKEDYTLNTLKEFRRHSDIKYLMRNFKFQRNFANFFYENEGENLNKMFRLAETNNKYRLDLINIFIHRSTPPKDFILEIKDI